MPTPYTGTPSGVQSPATAPDPATDPIVVLPVAGDADTAASVAQAFKVLADYIAWARSPRAKAGTWEQAIKVFRNAALQSRFLVDHLGFPAGKLVQWSEDWGFGPTNIPSGITGPSSGYFAGTRWKYSILTGGALLFDAAGARAGLMTMLAGGTGPFTDGLVNVEAGRPVTNVGGLGGAVDNDIAIAMQWDAAAGAVPHSELAMGLAYGGATPGSGHFSAVLPEAVAIVKRDGHANWEVYSKVAAGAALYTDTGIAYDGHLMSCRIERIGANASDDGIARANVYLNGNLIAIPPIMIRQPTVFFQSSFVFDGSLGSAGWGPNSLLIGPVDVRANTWPGDVAF